MKQWITNCISWNVPEHSLQLHLLEHQPAYTIWLQILMIWATTTYSTTRLIQVSHHYEFAKPEFKQYLPTQYWGDNELLEQLEIPFPYYLLAENPGLNYHIIQGTNIFPDMQMHSHFYSMEQLTTLMDCPYVFLYARSHYFLPTFYNESPLIRKDRLKKINSKTITVLLPSQTIITIIIVMNVNVTQHHRLISYPS